MKIKEMIVVEGKSDTQAIKRAVDADTIETNGSAVSKQTIEIIRHAQGIRGVILFTDPDYPGERIRKIVSQAVPGCKHAFITRQEGYGGAARSLGIEHASPDVIRSALKEVYTERTDIRDGIPFQALIEFGLVAGPSARARRERLGELLKIGYTNGKQLHKRLAMFQITDDQFEKVLKQVLQEEKNG